MMKFKSLIIALIILTSYNAICQINASVYNSDGCLNLIESYILQGSITLEQSTSDSTNSYTFCVNEEDRIPNCYECKYEEKHYLYDADVYTCKSPNVEVTLCLYQNLVEMKYNTNNYHYYEYSVNKSF